MFIYCVGSGTMACYVKSRKPLSFNEAVERAVKKNWPKHLGVLVVVQRVGRPIQFKDTVTTLREIGIKVGGKKRRGLIK